MTTFSRSAVAALAATALLAGCAPSPGATEATGNSTQWVEPSLYTVNAQFSGAWFYTGWNEIVVADGVVVSVRPLDEFAEEFAEGWGMDLSFFEAPGSVLNRAASEPADDDSLNLEYTVERDGIGSPVRICWDDPQAVDEEGCWTWTDYREGDVSPDPTPEPTETAAPVTWDEPANYTYTLVYSIFGPAAGTYDITVKDHKVVSFKAREDVIWGPDDGGLRRKDLWTIGELVDLYNELIVSEDGTAALDFDPETGVPASVTLDWILLAADDEQYFTITNFTPTS